MRVVVCKTPEENILLNAELADIFASLIARHATTESVPHLLAAAVRDALNRFMSTPVFASTVAFAADTEVDTTAPLSHRADLLTVFKDRVLRTLDGRMPALKWLWRACLQVGLDLELVPNATDAQLDELVQAFKDTVFAQVQHMQQDAAMTMGDDHTKALFRDFVTTSQAVSMAIRNYLRLLRDNQTAQTSLGPVPCTQRWHVHLCNAYNDFASAIVSRQIFGSAGPVFSAGTKPRVPEQQSLRENRYDKVHGRPDTTDRLLAKRKAEGDKQAQRRAAAHDLHRRMGTMSIGSEPAQAAHWSLAPRVTTTGLPDDWAGAGAGAGAGSWAGAGGSGGSWAGEADWAGGGSAGAGEGGGFPTPTPLSSTEKSMRDFDATHRARVTGLASAHLKLRALLDAFEKHTYAMRHAMQSRYAHATTTAKLGTIHMGRQSPKSFKHAFVHFAADNDRVIYEDDSEENLERFLFHASEQFLDATDMQDKADDMCKFFTHASPAAIISAFAVSPSVLKDIIQQTSCTGEFVASTYPLIVHPTLRDARDNPLHSVLSKFTSTCCVLLHLIAVATVMEQQTLSTGCYVMPLCTSPVAVPSAKSLDLLPATIGARLAAHTLETCHVLLPPDLEVVMPPPSRSFFLFTTVQPQTASAAPQPPHLHAMAAMQALVHRVNEDNRRSPAGVQVPLSIIWTFGLQRRGLDPAASATLLDSACMQTLASPRTNSDSSDEDDMLRH